MDQRAQISIEYILLVAVVLIIVVVFATVITNSNEQNTVATAVQLGADNATTTASFINTTQPPVKVTFIDMTNVDSVKINMVIHFSGPITNPNVVFGSISNSLIAANYNNISQNGSSLILTTQPGSVIAHIYNITLG
jgi:uncharacterized protein (UPF0333 family)